MQMQFHMNLQYLGRFDPTLHKLKKMVKNISWKILLRIYIILIFTQDFKKSSKENFQIHTFPYKSYATLKTYFHLALIYSKFLTLDEQKIQYCIETWFKKHLLLYFQRS